MPKGVYDRHRTKEQVALERRERERCSYKDPEFKRRRRQSDKKWYQQNRVNHQEKMKEYYSLHKEELRQKRETLEGRLNRLFNAARYRAKQNGLAFSITKDWLKKRFDRCQGMCEQTGDVFDLKFLDDHRNPYAPSLDQIKPGAGYTTNNVQIVCWWWNSFKENRSDAAAWKHFKRIAHKKGLI